jgi:CTP synthase
LGVRDSYKSVYEALTHGGIANEAAVEIVGLDSEQLSSPTVKEALAGFDGLVVPGGFGDRGVLGKMAAIQFARETELPFLGICLGMQLACLEYARNVLGISDATSEEFDAHAKNRIIHIMESQLKVDRKGGTMRLGAYDCVVKRSTKTSRAYGADRVSERHRHRYEFNPEYRARFEQSGFVVAGESPDGTLVEVMELSSHPYFVGCQFHPELKSRPVAPHPLFRDLIAGALARKEALRTS